MVDPMNNMNELTMRFIGALFFGRFMLLAAAAQGDFYEQKKALQYNMAYTLAMLAFFVVCVDMFYNIPEKEICSE